MDFKDTFFSRNHSINCRGRLLDLSTPKVMAILNLTPDSFYDGGRYTDKTKIKERIEQIISEGADIIDLGGYSSRPGAEDVDADKEYDRIAPAMEILAAKKDGILVSVDTFRTEVAGKLQREFGFDILNDISAGEDPELIEFAANEGIPCVVMHMKGNPRTMQDNPVYTDVVDELLDFFDNRIQVYRKTGVKDIIIDPGFGFGKTIEHNFTLLSALEVFSCLEVPVLTGLSRKSMIYKSLGCQPRDALNGTTALHMFALGKGASILRVHDVKAAREVVRLYMELNKRENTG